MQRPTKLAPSIPPGLGRLSVPALVLAIFLTAIPAAGLAETSGGMYYTGGSDQSRTQSSQSDLYSVQPKEGDPENMSDTSDAAELFPTRAKDVPVSAVLLKRSDGSLRIGVHRDDSFSVLETVAPLEKPIHLSADGSTVYYHRESNRGEGPEIAAVPVSGDSPERILSPGVLLDVSAERRNLLVADPHRHELSIVAETNDDRDKVTDNFDPAELDAQFCTEHSGICHERPNGNIAFSNLDNGVSYSLTWAETEVKHFTVSSDLKYLAAVVDADSGTDLVLYHLNPWISWFRHEVDTEGNPTGEPDFSPENRWLVWRERLPEGESTPFFLARIVHSEDFSADPQLIPDTEDADSDPVWSY